jgi:hypothetical protein
MWGFMCVWGVVVGGGRAEKELLEAASVWAGQGKAATDPGQEEFFLFFFPQDI